MSPRHCVFCSIVAGDAPASPVLETDRVLAFLDIYPMRPGHVLVIPKRHAQWLHELAPSTRSSVFEVATAIATAMRRSSLPCDDVNVVVNDGPIANQTVPHVHMHVIPRRQRDLPLLLRMLLQRPVQPLLGGPSREALDTIARSIRAHCQAPA